MGDEALEFKAHSKLDLAWLTSVFLFGLALFVSKSLLTLMGPVLIIWSFADPRQRKVWKTNKKILLLLSLFPLALITNFFSIGGLTSVVKVFLSWHWPLLVAPALSVYKDAKACKFFFTGLALGLLIAVLHSFLILAFNFAYLSEISFMSENFRIASFWDVSRWGFFTGLSILTLFLVLHEKISSRVHTRLFILFSLTLISFIVSNTRGPLIALLIVFALLSLTGFKILRNAVIFSIILFSFLLFNSPTFDRVKSIFSVEMRDQKITSNNKSNASRLYMWKVAKDFFSEQPLLGTGYESSEKPLKAFLQKQDSSYVAEISTTEFSYNDQHSSYINSLVQMGFIFFMLCWGLIFYIFFKELLRYLKTRNHFNRFCLALLIYCFIVFVFYSSFNSYESLVVFITLAILGEDNKEADKLFNTRATDS
ncbi:MAG: O-antigen ligase family protein [Bdellovibrionaceae bacterium]|nr:O-antigen ligase family protein [Pseudobdellovibrionaceae bacterium]